MSTSRLHSRIKARLVLATAVALFAVLVLFVSTTQAGPAEQAATPGVQITPGAAVTPGAAGTVAATPVATPATSTQNQTREENNFPWWILLPLLLLPLLFFLRRKPAPQPAPRKTVAMYDAPSNPSEEQRRMPRNPSGGPQAE